jgi:hypothetical protein
VSCNVAELVAETDCTIAMATCITETLTAKWKYQTTLTRQKPSANSLTDKNSDTCNSTNGNNHVHSMVIADQA